MLGIQKRLESPRTKPCRVWRAHAAFLSLASPTRTMAFFATSTRCALSVEELCRVWGNCVYLARPSACCHDCAGVLSPAPEFGENEFLSLHGQDLYPKD